MDASIAGISWASVLAFLRSSADWAGQQAHVAVDKTLAVGALFRLTHSMDEQVLATINAIVAAMMVVIFSHPESIRGGVIELRKSGRVTANPADLPRIAYNEAVQTSGWLCLASTLIMTLYRPGERADPILLVLASLLTTFGCFLGAFHFIYRYVHLKHFGAGLDDQPGDGLRPAG